MDSLCLSVEGCEDIWAEIELPHQKSLVVGSIYRHPRSDLAEFKEAFTARLYSFGTHQSYAILGDFNADLNKYSTNSISKQYFNQIYSCGCTQLINIPTRVSESSNTIIDHIYANSLDVNRMVPCVLMYDITDHLPISVQIKLTFLKSNKCNRPKIRNITPKLIERFVHELEEILVSPEMRNSTEIEKLINLMSRLTNQYFPKANQSRKQYKNAQKP